MINGISWPCACKATRHGPGLMGLTVDVGEPQELKNCVIDKANNKISLIGVLKQVCLILQNYKKDL
jgi:hypothetical protein